MSEESIRRRKEAGKNMVGFRDPCDQLSRDLAAEKQRFQTHLEAWRENSRASSARIAELERQRDSGEYVCRRCGLRQELPARDEGF